MKLSKRIIRSNFVKKLLCKIVYLYIKFVLLTSKVKTIFHDFDFDEYAYTQSIYATWHGRVMLMPIVNPTKLKSCAIVSDHNDGRLIGGVIAHAGVELIYGSSNKNRLSSIKEILKGIKKGLNFLVTPDGPRGPARKVDGAIINIASTTRLPIIPSSCSAKSKKIFNSWDNFMLPLPFNEITLVFAKPIHVPTNLSAEDKSKYNEILQNSLNQITDIADKRVNHHV
jgi:lysophospholipid acyltransferase (LPLAT)-like uncharacterized protein